MLALVTTSLRTPIRLTHHRLLRKIEEQTGMPRGLLIERAVELLAENTLKNKKARRLLQDIHDAEADFRAGRTRTLAEFERERR